MAAGELLERRRAAQMHKKKGTCAVFCKYLGEKLQIKAKNGNKYDD